MKEDNLDTLFRTLTARKISVISRLAGLNDEEIKIMRLRWLENKTDLDVCDELGMSLSTLGRKRRDAKIKLVDAMDLYGLTDLESLPAAELLDYNGMFYKCQDMLIRLFMKHGDREDLHDLVYGILKNLGD